MNLDTLFLMLYPNSKTQKQEILMKRLKSVFLKPLSILPALMMMYLIFGFSAQTGETSGNISYEISYKLVETANVILDKDFTEQELSDYAHKIEYPIRKIAHMGEYFLLALTVSFPLYVYGLRGLRLPLTTFLICVAFACSDEFHQSFVADREPALRDVGIDSIGIVIEIVLWQCMQRWISVRRRKKKC